MRDRLRGVRGASSGEVARAEARGRQGLSEAAEAAGAAAVAMVGRGWGSDSGHGGQRLGRSLEQPQSQRSANHVVTDCGASPGQCGVPGLAGDGADIKGRAHDQGPPPQEWCHTRMAGESDGEDLGWEDEVSGEEHSDSGEDTEGEEEGKEVAASSEVRTAGGASVGAPSRRPPRPRAQLDPDREASNACWEDLG